MDPRSVGLHPAAQAIRDLSCCYRNGRFLMTRRRGGSRETVFTTFDHAHMAARLFDITGCKKTLDQSISTVVKLVQQWDDGYVWSFSDAVADIPPDVDSTAACLLLLQRGIENGLSIDEDLHPAQQLAQFEGLLAKPHGIYTFFGDRRPNDVDPLVNIAVAELVIRTGIPFAGLSSIADFLNSCLGSYEWGTPISEYYVGCGFLAERLTTLAHMRPDMFDSRVLSKLDDYLLCEDPADDLSIALIGIACERRGFLDRQRMLINRLRNRRGMDGGWWGFAPLYVQRTPRYEYGCELLTTLLAIQAGAATAGA